MAATTFAQAWAKTGAGFKVLDQAYKAAATNGTNLVDLIQTYQNTAQYEGREASNALSAFLSFRDSMRSMLRTPTGEFNPGVALMARSTLVNSSRLDVSGQLNDIYNFMAAAAPVQCVTSRGFVRGSFVAGAPFQGNTVFKRCWIDAYGFPIEVGYPEAYTLKCVADQNQGNIPFKGQERWQISGQPFIDELEWTLTGRGSGLFTVVSAASADTSLLANASFGTTPAGGDATPNGTATLLGTTYGNIGGWLVVGGLVGDGTDIVVNRATYYQEASSEAGSPGCLEVKTSKTIFQPLRGSFSNNVPISFDRPYWPAIKVKADNTGQWTGTIALTLGGKTWTKTIVAQAGWIDVAPDANDAAFNQPDLWYQNWAVAGAKFQIQITKTSGAATSLKVDNSYLQAMGPITCPQTSGTMFFMLPISGSTDAVVRDTGTLTDTCTDATVPAVLQAWSHRTWGTSWPARPAAPTTAAPSQPTQSATAGAVTAGTHVGGYTFVSFDGVEGPISASSIASAAQDGAHKMNIAGLPAGGAIPANIQFVRLYSSKANTAAPLYYTGTQVAAGTANSDVNAADAALTVQAPVISLAEP